MPDLRTGAVLQLNPGGEAIVLDSGGYGPVLITQSMTIAAPPGVLAFIHPPAGDGVTVIAPGATVVLRGLSIDGAGVTGNGIHVGAVAALHVENCVIAGFAGTDPYGSGLLFSSDGQLFVKDCIVRGNGWVGISVRASLNTAQASVDRCRLEGNTWGLESRSGFATCKVTIRDSVASGNGVGLWAVAQGELNIEGCVIANNGTGLESYSGTVRASNCTITDNEVGLSSMAAGALLSRSNNSVQGNPIKGAFTGTFTAD